MALLYSIVINSKLQSQKFAKKITDTFMVIIYKRRDVTTTDFLHTSDLESSA